MFFEKGSDRSGFSEREILCMLMGIVIAETSRRPHDKEGQVRTFKSIANHLGINMDEAKDIFCKGPVELMKVISESKGDFVERVAKELGISKDQAERTLENMSKKAQNGEDFDISKLKKFDPEEFK